MKKLLLVLLILSALGIGWFYTTRPPADPKQLTLYGNVDIREVHLGFRVAGKLDHLAYDEGDKVKAGDVLATLDNEPFRNQVASAVAQLKSLRERLKLREKGNRPQEIAQARATVHEREAAALNAKQLLERSDKTLAINGISAQDWDNAQAEARAAEARLTSAQENLALLEAGFRVEDIAQAKADQEQAEAALATAQLQLKDTVLVSPSNGVIMTRAQEAGSILPTGATVYTLSLQAPVWVRAYVHEPELGRLHPGEQVEVYTDAKSKQPYLGKIGYISPRAEFTPKSVETPELRTSLVYRLRIVITEPDEGLRQGMPVTIKLAAE